MADWLTLLQEEVARTSQRAAANRLGVSATTVCQVLGGRYSAGTERVAARVMEELGWIDCPHQGALATNECHDLRNRPMPTHSPEALRQWRACRGCDRR